MKQFDDELDPNTAHLWVVDLASVGFPGGRKSSIASFGGRTRARAALPIQARPPCLSCLLRSTSKRPDLGRSGCSSRGVASHEGPKWPALDRSAKRATLAALQHLPHHWISRLPSHGGKRLWCGRRSRGPIPRPQVAEPADPGAVRTCPHCRPAGPRAPLRLLAPLDAERSLCQGAGTWGLSPPFEQLPFECHEDGIRLDIDPTLDDGGQWYFEQWQARPGYILSLAVRRGQEAFRGVVRHTGVPSATPP